MRKLWDNIVASWQRFLTGRRTRKVLMRWASDLAHDMSRFGIVVDIEEDIPDALDRLDDSLEAEERSQAMATLFPMPGPFQRRMMGLTENQYEG